MGLSKVVAPDPSLVNPATSSQEPIVNPVTFFSTLSFQGNAYDPQLDHFDEVRIAVYRSVDSIQLIRVCGTLDDMGSLQLDWQCYHG